MRELEHVDVQGVVSSALAPGGGRPDLPAARIRVLAKLPDDELEALTRLSAMGSLAPSSRHVYATGIFSLAGFLLDRGLPDDIPPPAKEVGFWLLAFRSPSTGAQYLSHVAKAVRIAGYAEDDWCPATAKDQLKSAGKERLLAGCEEEFLPAVFARPQVQAQIE